MKHRVKINPSDLTYGTWEPDPLLAAVYAQDLYAKGYRRTSNAFCIVSRIDRDDWLDVLAKERYCSRADFYNVDGTGIGDQHRDYYVRVYSKDKHTVAPEVVKLIPPYR